MTRLAAIANVRAATMATVMTARTRQSTPPSPSHEPLTNANRTVSCHCQPKGSAGAHGSVDIAVSAAR